MKAFVLTRCNTISEDDIQLIQSSDIFKICVNNAEYNCNYRLFHDYSHYENFVKYFPEPLITSYHALQCVERTAIQKTGRFVLYYNTTDIPNTKDKNELYFATGSIVPSVDYCIKQDADEILLVADNTVYSENFRNGINKAIEKLSKYSNIYQFSNGKFNLPIKSIKEFIEN